MLFVFIVACASVPETVDYSSASYGALTGKSKIVQKPTLIKLGMEPLKMERARGYMSSLFDELIPELEKTNITYQMAGNDIVLTIQSHLIIDNNLDMQDAIKPQLNNIIATLSKYDRNFIEFTGHTSSVGDKNKNLRKSVDMASMVAKYFMTPVLESGGRIMGERVFINGMGESMWVADNSTPEGRFLNHRIEVRISPLR